MKKIVKGNDFTMRVIVNKIVDGEQQPFSLPACEEVKALAVGRYRRYELQARVDAKDDSVLLVRVEGDKLPLGKYALEVKGKLFGNDWRSNEYCQFALVDSNAEADTEFRRDLVEGEDSVEMDTAIVFLPPEAGMVELADRFKAETLKEVREELDRQLPTDAYECAKKRGYDGTEEEYYATFTEIGHLKENIKGTLDGMTEAERQRVKTEQLRVEAEAMRVETDKEIKSTLEYVNAQKYIKENEYEREVRAIEAIRNAPKDPTQDVWLDATDGEIKSGPAEGNLTRNAITYYYLGKRTIKGAFTGSTREVVWKGNEWVRHLDVRNWDMTLCTDANSKFKGWSGLQYLDASSWKLSSLVNAKEMFKLCISIRILDTSNWKLSALVDASQMFSNCYALQMLDFRKSSFRNLTNAYLMFGGCNSLAELWLPLTFDELTSLDLNISSWGSTLNGLASLRWTFGEGADDRTAKGLQPLTVRLSVNAFNLLTEEERAAALAKGYTITK